MVLRRLNRSKWLALALAGYWLALCISTHVPSSYLSRTHIHVWDKLAHFASFGVLAFLALALLATWRRITWYLYLVIFGIVALYAAVDESAQLLVPSRTADLEDWFANVLGAASGLAFYRLVTTAWELWRWFRQRASA